MAKKNFSFMKPTADNSLIDAHEKYVEDAKNAHYPMFRFYLRNPGDEAQITFLDGDIDENGVLICTTIKEHQIFESGTVNMYTCTEMAGEPCPICASGDHPATVSFLTVIDHSSFQGKTKVYKDTRKLFVMKPTTFKMLSKKAVKYKGLTGITFDVTRTNKTDPSVGNDFDYVGKLSLKEITAAYPETFENQQKAEAYSKHKLLAPADLEVEVPYRDAEEIMKTTKYTGGGAVTGDKIGNNEGSATDYSNEV